MMMPMSQLDLDEPGAVRLTLHGVGRQIPIIEITSEMDLFSFRGHSDEVYRLGHLLCGIPIGSEEGTYLMHQTTNIY